MPGIQVRNQIQLSCFLILIILIHVPVGLTSLTAYTGSMISKYIEGLDSWQIFTHIYAADIYLCTGSLRLTRIITTLLGTNIFPPSRHFWVDDFPNFPFGGICCVDCLECTGFLTGGKGFTADGKAFDAPDLRYPIIEPSGIPGTRSQGQKAGKAWA